jgi:hypothetical protein
MWSLRPVAVGCVSMCLAALVACGRHNSDPPQAAETYPPLPPSRGLHRWDLPHFPLRFCIDVAEHGFVANEAFEESVIGAFREWGVPFQSDGICDHHRRAGDSINSIGWGSLPAARDASTYEAGVTDLRYQTCAKTCESGEDGSLVEADITIDVNPPAEYRTAQCLSSTLVHEVGHLLGLEHLPPPSVMQAETADCPVYTTDTDRRALNARYGELVDRVSTTRTSEAVRAVYSLVLRQLDLMESHDWVNLYATYTPRFQALCPYARFLELSEPPIDARIEMEGIRVRVEGERAYVVYNYVVDGTPTAAGAEDSDPDVYSFVNGSWLDDIDSHTNCE